MARIASRILGIGVVITAVGLLVARQTVRPSDPSRSPGHSNAALASITIDYPEEGSIFPPEIIPPTFLWRDATESARLWRVDVTFPDGSAAIRAMSTGERLQIGEIDPRCIANTNELPKLTPQQAAARTWTPDAETWAAIKTRSTTHPATVAITGLRGTNPDQPVSRGQVSIRTSKDPVGAPVFYRDVPLMPSELEKGVIKPLPPSAIPLVAWRLRNIAEPRSRLLLDGLPTCANCHSFSLDGKTLGLDLDGPRNDKGMYAIASISPQMSIHNEDVISWDSFRDRPASPMRVGFMSQVSPDGRFVVTSLNGEKTDLAGSYYVANFKDYRFLQVFYPTRGILAWYSRDSRRIQSLPGADSPRYVQTDAVWSPDGKYIVFARARAREPYPVGRKMAEFAGDPNETPIQYDLYRIPFNEGKGGEATPIAGASGNGTSNCFPKVSPNGRWLVFVQCRNGQLMRPDSKLYIVPVEGGEARRMRCNTPLMNSWHSFSPNGRWLVFSSKARSPYTQMYLTHLDEDGRDSPPILVDNATAANRAVNIPEFVNIPPEGLLKIDVPAVEFYRLYERAWELTEKGQDDAAIAAWKQALVMSPGDGRAHSNLGAVLLRRGKLDEAISHFERALEVNPGSPASYNNLGALLLRKERFNEATSQFQKALKINPEFAEARFNLASAFYMQGKTFDAVAQWREGLRLEPTRVSVLTQAAWALATSPKASVRNGAEAVVFAEQAVRLSGGRDPEILDTLAAAYAEAGRYSAATQTARRALALAEKSNNGSLADAIKGRIVLYEARKRFRETKPLSPSPPR
ncbi:MAG TPA: tetratricopeptide repeat protein [Bryobacteraceae bacterium]|nr:tetratricopeptide repeat protein [Bryobacteraceae bacterium]